MANVKIPQLPARTTALTGDEEFEIAYNSASYRLTTENLFKTIGVLPLATPSPTSGYLIPLFKSSDGQPYSCTLDQALTIVGTVPAGGTTGQFLVKASDTDYDTTWSTESGLGTVTSVALSGGTTGLTVSGSPITTSGTITLYGTLVVANGGTGLASGTSGGILGYTASGTLASSVALTANAIVLGGGAGSTPVPMASLGTSTTVLHGNAAGSPTFGAVVLTTDVSGILPAANGGTGVSSLGTLSRVDDTNVTMTLGGTPTGALINAVSMTLGWTGTLAVARGGTGASSLGTLSRVDDTNVTLTLGGTPTNALVQNVSITAGWSGQLAVTRGGTGLASVTQGDIIYASASNTFASLAKSTTATRYLSNTGSSNNPAWAQVDLSNGVTGNLSVIASGGSTSRTLQAHFGDWLSVKDFGATGDASTDDTAAIQAAVNAAASAGGGIVYFPAAAGYRLTSSITISSDRCALVGPAAGRTAYIFAPNAVNAFVFSHATPATNSLSDLAIQNLTIWGPSAPTSGIGISLIRCNRVYMSNVDVRAFFQGVKVEGGVEQFYTNMTIGGAVWAGAAAGSYLMKIMAHAGASETPSELFISNFNFKGTSGTPYLENGIILEACDGLWMANGHAGFASNAGLQIVGSGASTSIVNIDMTNVMFDGNAGTAGYGIRTSGSSGGTLRELKFTGCTFDGHDNHGVELGLAAMARVNFTGCQFSSNENWGLKIDAGTGYIVSGCSFYDNNSAAGSEGDISLDGVTNVVISGNTMEAGGSAQAYGVLIGSGSNDQITITGTSFVGCTTDIQVNSVVDDLWLDPSNKTSKSDTIASANPLSIPNVGSTFHVSGTTNFSTISASYAIGRIVTLIFDGVLTVSTGASLTLQASMTTAANNTLTIVNDGTVWREVARSPVPASGTGDVVGPGSATDNALARFDSTTGKLIQNSGVIVDDSNNVSGVGTLASGAQTITSTSANALAVGANGTTNPVLKVNANTASVATGIQITGAAAAARVAFAVMSSGTDEGLSIDAKGSGTIRLGATSTGAIEFSRAAVPTSSDGAALGTTALMWSDLFLASGAVINFNNGNVTLTHSAATLTIAGATSLAMGTSIAVGLGTIEVGAASDTTVSRDSAGVIAVEGVPLYSNIPQNSQSTAYTLVLSDAQKHILHPTADNNARTFTIPANGSVAYPIGTCLTFVNQINTVTIAITTDTLVLAGAGTTGSRTLAANGIATAIKVASTTWMISGTGLT